MIAIIVSIVSLLVYTIASAIWSYDNKKNLFATLSLILHVPATMYLFPHWYTWKFQVDSYRALLIFLASTTFVTSIFVFLGIILALLIIFMQGKGDMGLSGSWKSSKVIFGGSGGQDVIGKTVWVLGFLFLAASLVLAKIEQKNSFKSVFGNYYSSPDAGNAADGLDLDI